MVSTENEGPILAEKILERINEMEIKEEDKRLIKNFIEAFHETQIELKTCIHEYYILKQGLKGLKHSYD